MWNRSSGSISSGAPWRRTPVTPIAASLSPRTTAAASPGSLYLARMRWRLRSNPSAGVAGGWLRFCLGESTTTQPDRTESPERDEATRVPSCDSRFTHAVSFSSGETARRSTKIEATPAASRGWTALSLDARSDEIDYVLHDVAVGRRCERCSNSHDDCLAAREQLAGPYEAVSVETTGRERCRDQRESGSVAISIACHLAKHPIHTPGMGENDSRPEL